MFADAVSECWLDVNEVLPFDSKELPQFITGRSDRNEFGIELCNVEADYEQQPEVSISELESLLLMDSDGAIIDCTGQRAGYATVDPDELGSVCDNVVTQFDFSHHVTEEEPATVSFNVDEDLTSDEDDSRDVTWSYRTQTKRVQHRRRHCHRSNRRRRLTMTRNNMADERKKQQNKSAATRYREKKRSEEIANETLCAELEKRNKELRTRVQDMTQEAAVLRQLVIDIFRSPSACTA